MTELQDRTTDDQTVAEGGQPGGAETRTAEPTVDVVLATANAVFHSLWEGQDAAAGVVRQWAGRLTGVPFTALIEGGASLVSGRVWVDCTFEMVDALVDMQRRSVLQMVGLQRRTAGLLAGLTHGQLPSSGLANARSADRAGTK
jgi:hypothetical protein